MSEATFAVKTVYPLLVICERPACVRLARYEIRLIGSSVRGYEVCQFHKRWAKAALVERESAWRA